MINTISSFIWYNWNKIKCWTRKWNKVCTNLQYVFDNIGFDFFNQLLRLGYVIRDKRKIMATNVINRFEERLTFMVAFVSQASGFLPENKRNRLEDQLYIMLEGLRPTFVFCIQINTNPSAHEYLFLLQLY